MKQNSISRYLKSYKTNSIIIRNFLTITIVVIIPFLLLFINTYLSTNKNMEQEINELNKPYLLNISNYLENVYSEMKLLAYTISQDSDIVMFTLEKKKDNLYSYSNNINKILQNYTLMYKYIDSIYIYSDVNRYIISNNFNENIDSFPDKSWLSLYNTAQANEFIIQPRRKSEKYPYFLSFITPIYTDVKSGAVVVNIDIEQLSKVLLGSEKSDNELYVLDKYKKLMFCNQHELLYDSFGKYDFIYDRVHAIQSGRDNSLLYTIKSPVSGWEYISIIPLSSYKSKTLSTAINTGVIFLLMVLSTLAVSFYISIKTFKPIGKIITVLDDPANTNTTSINNEVQYILDNISQTIKDKRLIELELEKRLQLLNQAYAAALQAQINPHFLYNTLETINFMAYDICSGRKNPISDITTTLSQMLRIGLDSENKIVTLEKELEYLKLYIKILNIRYKNKCDFIFHIQEGTLGLNVVKLSLQPIVENAFYHGIFPGKRMGQISISAFTNSRFLIIEVSDNGIGISKNKLEEIREIISSDSHIFSKHIGLNNVNRRIKMFFGDQYGLYISSTENTGTTVTLKFPVAV